MTEAKPRERSPYALPLGRDIVDEEPEVMEAFAALGDATYKPDALDTLTKELIALAVSVNARCQVCIEAHALKALKAGATRAQVAETVAVCIHMGGGPSVAYGRAALVAYDRAAKTA